MSYPNHCDYTVTERDGMTYINLPMVCTCLNHDYEHWRAQYDTLVGELGTTPRRFVTSLIYALAVDYDASISIGADQWAGVSIMGGGSFGGRQVQVSAHCDDVEFGLVAAFYFIREANRFTLEAEQ